MPRAQLVICVIGAKQGSECRPPSCHSRRIMNKEVKLICSEECTKDLLNILERLDEQTVRMLQNICIGVGGCAEASIDEDKLCCVTRLESMPGLKSLSNALEGRGVKISLEKGLIKLCVGFDSDIRKVAENIRNVFLILESVYDTQRRIAEGVAKSISSIAATETRRARGESSVKKREEKGEQGGADERAAGKG